MLVNVSGQVYLPRLKRYKLVLDQVWQIFLHFGALVAYILHLWRRFLIQTSFGYPECFVLLDDFWSIGTYSRFFSSEIH